jgi:Lrp/AsnC family transcriptional regulator, regulator for asnA, asnC and gidA
MAKSKSLDETNLAIVRRLWDGRKPYAEIAEELGVTTNTVRNRVNRMMEDGALQIIGLVDPKAIKGHYSAFVTFQMEFDKIEAALEQIGAMRGVVAAMAVSGSFDIIAACFFNEEFNHERFIFEELQKVEGIRSVETHFTIKDANWQLRYVL